MPRKKKIKEQEEIVNIDDDKENFNDEHDNNTDLDGVRQDDEYDGNKLLFWIICHVYIITFEFNHFENVYYKHMLI